MRRKTNKILKIFYGNKEIDNFFGCKSSANINLCARGKRKTAKGYKWDYIERNDDLLKSQIN